MAEKKEKNRTRSFITLLAGIGIFIALKSFLAYGTFLAMILAILGYVAIRIIWPKGQKAREGGIEIAGGAGISAQDAHRIITQCTDKVREIRAMTMRIKDNRVAEEVRGICKAAQDIIENFRKDPKDIKRARQFVNYYLDSTVKIVTRYVELSNKQVITPDTEKSLKKVEELMQSVKLSFEKQLEMLLEDDLMDLDTEVEVLKKTLKMEGM
jgi:5-bromo-4-chloroindolyl phosphate hydrolysis protein